MTSDCSIRPLLFELVSPPGGATYEGHTEKLMHHVSWFQIDFLSNLFLTKKNGLKHDFLKKLRHARQFLRARLHFSTQKFGPTAAESTHRRLLVFLLLAIFRLAKSL